MNQKFAARNNKRQFYLLRSLLVCGTCGYTLLGRIQKGRVYYYCEYGGKNRPPDVPRHTCSIAAPLIEPLVWEAVAVLLHDPAQIAVAWDSASAQQTTPDEVARLQTRQQKLQRQWVRLLDAFEEGLLDKQELSQRKARLDQERQTLTERIEQLQCLQAHQSVKAQMMDDFAAFCEQIRESLQDPTPEVQQKVLRLLVESIVVEEDAITIKHIIPTDDCCRLLPRGNMQKPGRGMLNGGESPKLKKRRTHRNFSECDQTPGGIDASVGSILPKSRVSGKRTGRGRKHPQPRAGAGAL